MNSGFLDIIEANYSQKMRPIENIFYIQFKSHVSYDLKAVFA